ncbi:hypothetical protein Tco_0211983 [Tanacetum coccineum]
MLLTKIVPSYVFRHGNHHMSLLHEQTPDLSGFMYLGHSSYRQNDSGTWSEFIETFHVDFDECLRWFLEPQQSQDRVHEWTPEQSSSGTHAKPSPSTPFVPPSRN